MLSWQDFWAVRSSRRRFRGMIVDPGEAAAPLSCGVDLRGRQGAELLGHLNLDPSISSRCLLAVVVDPWCRRRYGEGVES